VTKSEAEIVKAALRYWRAAKGMDPESPGRQVFKADEIEKARLALLEAVDRAAPTIKDWVSVVPSANSNVGFLACAGCKDSQRVEGPFTMEKFAGIYQRFRIAHIDCGPVEDPA